MARERERGRLSVNVFAVTKRGQLEYRRRRGGRGDDDDDDGDDDILQRLFVSLTRDVGISLRVSIEPLDASVSSSRAHFH